MVASETIYQTNPYVKSTVSGKQYSLRNSMTGVAFKLSEASFSIYDLVRKRDKIKLSEVVNAFPQFPEESIVDVIQYFYTQRLLISDAPSDLATITKKDITLFDLRDVEDQGNLCLLGVPFGQGNPFPNSCSNFPDNFRVYAREKRISLKNNTINCNEVSNAYLGITKNYDFSPTAYKHVRDIGNIFIDAQYESKRLIHDKISYIANQIYKENVPFFLGGDHSITYSTLKAATKEYDNIHVIQFDAHTDTYTSKYDQLNHDELQHHHGNFMTKCLEWDQIKKVHQLGIRGEVNFGYQESSPKQAIVPCITLKNLLYKENFELNIPADSKIYITIDIDVLDPVFAPATATPVNNGLTIDELLKCLQIIYDRYHDQLIGFDLVEVSPHLYNTAKTTAVSAMHIILQLIQRFSYYAKNY